MNKDTDNVMEILNHAAATLSGLGYNNLVDAIVKQDYQIKRLEGLLQEAYKELRRVGSSVEKLEGRVCQLEPYYGD
jgi:hypothetical protein